LKNSKKLVVPCMICNATQEYKTKYTEEGYNVVCHNGIEKNTKTLQNYKEEWNKADLLIYSPTIEAGVDFDMKHFDLGVKRMVSQNLPTVAKNVFTNNP